MARTRTLRADNTWPGFVDALATLLLVIMFLLVVFMLGHFFLSQALNTGGREIQRLNAQISELADLLAMERADAAGLQGEILRLNASLNAADQEREELVQLLRVETERANLAEAALADAGREIEVGREAVAARLSEIALLNRDIDALRAVRDDLEVEVAALALALEEVDAEADRLSAELSAAELDARRREAQLAAALADLAQVRDRSLELEARLADERDRTVLAQRQVEEEQRISAEARAQVTLLNQQLIALRQQLLSLQGALEAAEARDAEQQVVIENLGQRLNSALAQRVEELSRFRSDFFGRLREVLGDRQDIRIEGDRFIFQSEVLFAVGEAALGVAGRAQLAQLAETLLEIAAEIPGDIGWVLRVDGHTDIQPINTPQFPSNWELSTARAVSVVTFLIAQGVPPQRLAATGFGEFQPIDDRQVEAAYQRNRRIELKLTER